MVIQRGWKILSDAGSTSASSTEANRSPTGLNSSSDDSNCSNQTTHSMVTSVASPAGNNQKLETSTHSSSNVNNAVTMVYRIVSNRFVIFLIVFTIYCIEQC